MKIGILTSGGDAPGMNTCVCRLTTSLLRKKHKVYAIVGGFCGLIDSEIISLDMETVENVSYLGGSFIKSFRCPEMKTEDGLKKAMATIKKNKFDCVIAIGGDGTLRGVRELSLLGANIIFIPATIDNDVMISEKSLGFSTAVNNAVAAIDKIEQTMESMNRGFIVETMGRGCSDIAVHCGLAVGATLIVTKESNLTKQDILKKMKASIKAGECSPKIIVQEHCIDIDELANYLQEQTGKEFRAITLGYLQRGGEPSVEDRILAIKFAKCVVDSLEKGQLSRVASILNDEACVLSYDVITKSAHKSSQYLVDFVD